MSNQLWRPVPDNEAKVYRRHDPIDSLYRNGLAICRLEATDDEAPTLDWDKATQHLAYMKKAYEDIGTAGVFGLSITIMPLEGRLERGERTKWLYDDIMEVE